MNLSICLLKGDVDTDVVTISCSVRPSAIPSVTILKIEGNRRP